jgi:hypothetical protein
MNDKLVYEALSYTWGDASNTRQIYLGGFPWEVTTNLEVALRHLKQDTKARTIWIDALCINQGDRQERSEQVQKMRDIFFSATTVLAWTGDSSEDSDAAIEAMRIIGLWSSERSNELFEYGLDGLTAEHIRRHGLDLSLIKWEALWSFWERPYWSWMWVIQELASCGVDKDPSEDRCIIGCGHNWIPKHQFDQTWLTLLYIGRSDGFSIGGAWEMEEPYRTLTVKELPGYGMGITLLQCEDGDDEDIFRKLIRLLGITADFKATDPRDKIYALLGISRKIDQAFIPDYCGPTQSVFKDLIKFSIKTDRTLECLLGNWDRSLESPLSWIPQLYGRLPTNESWANYGAFYQAAGGLEPIVDFDKDNDLLAA